MHGHLPRFRAEVVTARCHQPQLLDGEVGAEPGHAAHVEGACGFHQHDRQAHVSVCR